MSQAISDDNYDDGDHDDDDDDDEEEEEDGNNLLDLSHRLLRPVTALHIGWFSFFRYCHNSSSRETVKMANNMHFILGSGIQLTIQDNLRCETS